MANVNINGNRNTNTNPTTNYDYVYNVGLLDDLHNYFPAFLYDSGRFQTTVQVFHYIRSQMGSRFNLPAFGARLAGFQQSQQTQQTHPATPVTPRREVNVDLTSVLAGLLDLSRSPIMADISYFNIPQTRTFLDPIIVRPSDEVLARNTSIVTGENSSCAICQDNIVSEDMCRRLNTCQHIYHQMCIDTWFQTNVHCPTCRMDVRTVTANANATNPTNV